MKNRFSNKKSLIATLGSAAFLAGGVASASTLFQSDDLGNGYEVGGDSLIHLAEGKCGEGKCGGDDKGGEGKCGEGKCGGDGDDKGGEGKCGEGKCGG